MQREKRILKKKGVTSFIILQMASCICNWGPWRRGKRKRAEKTFEEIVADVFPNLMKTVKPQTPEIQWIPSKKHMKKTIPRHVIIKLFKNSDKKKILKVVKEKKDTIFIAEQGITDFSLKTVQAIR